MGVTKTEKDDKEKTTEVKDVKTTKTGEAGVADTGTVAATSGTAVTETVINPIESQPTGSTKVDPVTGATENSGPENQNIEHRDGKSIREADRAARDAAGTLTPQARQRNAEVNKPVTRNQLVLRKGLKRIHRGGRVWEGDKIYNVSGEQRAAMLSWQMDDEPLFVRYKAPAKVAAEVDPNARLADGTRVEEYLHPEAAIAPTQAIALRQELASAEEMAELFPEDALGGAAYSEEDLHEDDGVAV